MSTVTLPPVLTSPRDDAVQLYKAFKGFGCDTAAVVNILAHRNYTQRPLIQHEYKAMYGEELTSRLKSELSGNLEKAILAWLPDPAGRDATLLMSYLSGDVIDVKGATEIICSRTPSQLQQVKQIYHARSHSYLEHDVQRYASDDHLKFLLAFMSIPRYEGPEVDRTMADHHAKTLYKAGEKKLGTDESVFIKIFSESSSAHLVAISHAYKNMYSTSLKKALKSETSGLFEFALVTVLQCAENPAIFFAKELHKSMKGFGTNDITLIRIIITRAEIDMQFIKQEYHKKYGKTLNDAVQSETSGHYKNFLLALLGPSR